MVKPTQRSFVYKKKNRGPRRTRVVRPRRPFAILAIALLALFIFLVFEHLRNDKKLHFEHNNPSNHHAGMIAPTASR